MTEAYLVDVGYACFGIEVDDGVVTAAPPIARWMVGKPFTSVRSWVYRKHGRIEQTFA